MKYADETRTVRRLVRTRARGTLVVELHDFYVWVRPYRGHHSSGTAVTWESIYQLGVERDVEKARREKRRARR